MTFNDIFKSSFLENITSVSILDMAIALALAFGLGMFIFLVYKKTYQGVMYSSSFGTTLVALTMITTVVIIAVTSNVVLSLGMVGALSIVRFRTAIKEPLDIAFLFWSIAAGIVLAAGMIPLAVIGSVIIGVMLLVMVNRKSHCNPYIVVLSCTDPEAERNALAFLEENVQKCVVKSKSAQKGMIELNLEIRMKDDSTAFIGDIADMTGVNSAVLVSYNGEDWGLYLAVEGVEDAFLQRNYGSSHGELYKPDSSGMGGGRGNGGEFDMGDLPDEAGDVEQENNPDAGDGQPPDGGIPDAPSGFSKDDAGDMGSPPQDMESADDGGAGTFPGEQGAMQAPDEGGAGGGMGGSDDVLLKYIDDDIDSYPNIFDNAKTDASDSDMNRLIKSLKKLSGGEDLEDTVDVEEVIKYFAVHDFVLNFDSYTGSMIHNYYLYENDGQMQMIPWDYNLAFGGFVSAESAESLVNYPIDSPVSGGSMEDRPMIAWIFENEEYTELYHEYLAQFIDEYFNGGYFETMIDDVVSMISPYVEKDPTKFCSYEEFQTGVETLKEFCLLRAQSVSLQLDGEIGSTSDTQESSTLVAAGDLKISDMGTMNASERSDQNIDAVKPQDCANAGWDTNTEANENADTGQVPDPAGGSGEMQVANDMDQPPGESDMQEIHEQEKTEGSEMQNSLSEAAWIWLAVSAAVLAAGLVAAAVYRRRRYKKQ